MTATAAQTNGWCHVASASSPLQVARLLPLQASSQVGRGQFATFDANGRAALNDGTVPGLVSAGVAYPVTLSDQSSIAGQASATFWWGTGVGCPASAESGDGFTAADMGVPFWIADENTPGKLSNFGGDNRSLGGLVFGVDNAGDPFVWSGPLAQLVARAALAVSAFPLGSFQITDAAASTTTAERAIDTAALHGTITAVEFIGAAVAADVTDYATITIKRYTSADAYAAGVTVATYDTRAANQGAITAFTPAAFALSGTAANLQKLEGDVFTITVEKGGSGKSLIGAVRITGKVL